MPYYSLRAICLVGLFLCLAAPSLAQQGRDAPSGANPTAQVVQEQQLLGELRRIQGRVTIPDHKAALLVQPEGRDYSVFHERYLPWVAGVAIVGMIVVLAIFYFAKGRITLDDSPESGRKIKRFNGFERFSHWLTAASFIVLALTGLNYFFGKRLLLPLIGPDPFAAVSQWAKYAHNVFAFPFMLGLLFIIVLWIRDNIPDRYDANWLKRFGGFFSRGRVHPPARRFNAGQKLIFWSVALGGLAISVSGIIMLFPFWALGVDGMQTAQYVHSIIGVILTAIIIAHIYIGTIGMSGAYDAMSTGEVDVAWAKAHHSVWVEEEAARTGQATSAPPRNRGAVPAE